jgi:transposase
LGNEVARVRRLEVLDGPSGRRSWSDEVKAAIVAETLAPGVRVSHVAARHRVSPQQVTTWRRLAREGRLVLPAERHALFAPIVIAEETPTAEAPSNCSAVRWIEIVAGAITVRVLEDLSPARIAEIALRLAR